jgi:glycosyltransferase involved in cell wall biosynthesis
VTEGFGIEILEAMAYGRPVIVSRGAGGVDVVEDGVNGFVIEPRDVKGIKDRIQFFRDNPEAIKIMGEQARKTSMDYSWDKIEAKYVSMYKEILNG